MTIKSLHIYPIKGLGGIDVQEANLLERGMQYDRRWMLVDMDGVFISQRTDARLALFNCMIDGHLNVSYQDSEINIDLDEYSSVRILTTVWEHEVHAYEVNESVSKWFSDMLNVECLLVRMTDDDVRYKELIKGPKQTKVSFADGYPYHIIGTASIDQLSEIIGSEIAATRFRANIIVNTTEAHEEDTWNQIDIGNAKVQVIKPCARCLVVNIDQSTAEMNKEPLKSLSTYRRVGDKVNFGANAICLIQGKIKVGDTLFLID